MFLIPLGLQSRLLKWPLASLVIVIATSAISYFFFPSNALYIRDVHQIVGTDSDVAAHKNELLEVAKTKNIFMRGHGTWSANLKAIVTHEGWVHLIGNMVIFALFAVFVELRIGVFGLFLLFILGGFLSNLVQISFLPYGIRLLGASGAVSAVIGAFAVYFHQQKIRCWLCVGFVYNRIILMPAWLFIALFLVASDVIGVLSTDQGMVAHLSHLSGFAVGAGFAFLQQDLFPLRKTFLFPLEQNLYYQAKDSRLVEEKLALYKKIHSINQDSFYAFRGLFMYFCKQGFLLNTFNEVDQKFIETVIARCLSLPPEHRDYDMAQDILTLVPLTWDIAHFELHLGPEELLAQADLFRKGGDLIQALRFYDLFFVKYAVHTSSQNAQTEVLQIFDQLEKFEPEMKKQIVDKLLLYADHHPNNFFQTQLRQMIQRLNKGEPNAAG